MSKSLSGGIPSEHSRPPTPPTTDTISLSYNSTAAAATATKTVATTNTDFYSCPNPEETTGNMIPRANAADTNTSTVSSHGKPVNITRNKSGPEISLDFILEPLRFTSSDFVEGILLDKSDTKLASSTSEENRETAGSENRPQETEQLSQQDGCYPMLELTDKFGRITTGDDIMTENYDRLASSDWMNDCQPDSIRSRFNTGDEIMNEDIRISSNEWTNNPRSEPVRSRSSTGDDIMKERIRMTSSEWISDYKNESMRSIGPDLVFGVPSGTSNASGTAPSLAPPSISTHPLPPPQSQIDNAITGQGFEELFLRSESNLNDDILSLELHTGSVTSKKQSPSCAKSPSSSTKSKKRKKRIINESQACDPTDEDVLFGRGGFTNTHPGNNRFRNQALELRPWYEQSTKEEKYNISDLLVESVKIRGGRFLERGGDGLWHEVCGNGVRKKASQALRERVKRKTGSSIVSPKSSPGGETRYDENDNIKGAAV